MKPSFKEIYDDLFTRYHFIDTDTFEVINDDDSLLLIVDTCVTNLVPITNINELKNDIVIIDHHKPDEKQIKTDNLFINLEVSSASEIIFYLLKSLDMYISQDTAQLLLAGIYLDTNGLYYISESQSFKLVSKLLEYGANIQEVQNLFTIYNFEDDRKQKRIVNGLVDCTKFYHDINSRRYAITYNTVNPYIIYTHEQLAEACDSLLQYPLDAAIVIGYIDREDLGMGHVNKIAIKARSKMSDDMIDVSEIMDAFGGGGDLNRAAAQIFFEDIVTVKETLKKFLKQKDGILEKKDVQKVLFK